jgi:hypothetical protein
MYAAGTGAEMRAPFSFFGSISPRVLAPVFVVLILSAFTNANAQLANPGLGGGFEVDGNLFANNPGGIIGLGDDWLSGAAGPGTGVLNKNGSPKDPLTTFHVLDKVGGADLTVFDGSNKVDANPNTYKWKTGSAPQKDDIQNGLAYFSEDNSGNHWMRVAGDRQSTSGDSYIDYEFLQTTLTKNANGTFSSAGAANGRTVGDILLTIHLAQGGSQAEFYAQRWQAVAGGYDYVTIPYPSGAAFVAANIDSTINSTYDIFGTRSYVKNQFGEAAVNLDAVLPNFGRCFGIATVFVRTKSSTSESAVLKDFIEPVQVNMCLDDTPPVLTPPLDVTLKCNQSTAPGNVGVGTATDDCDANVQVSYHDDIIPGGCAQNYTIQRTWTAVDHCGNSATAMQTIVVEDNTGPIILTSPAPLTLQCDGDIPNPNPTSVTTTGECGKVTITHVSDVSDGNSCPEVITRTYRASDECGNFTNVTQKITIDDTTPPQVGTLSPISVQCSDNVPAANINVVTASDNCGQVKIEHLSDVSNHQSCPEIITRTYRVTDKCGNVTDRTQTITINDDVPPSVGLVYPATVQCKGDVPAPNIALVSASDNCSTPVVRFLSDVSDGKTCPEIITRTYRVTDACGNVTDRIQQITIKDTINPSISGPADVTLSCSGQIPAANKSLITASDNCGTPVVSIVGDVSDGKSCPQVILRTYRATDGCGNSSDWVQKITVDDRGAPTAQPLADINVSCVSEVPAPNPNIVNASDNCGQVLVSHLGDQAIGNGCGGKIVRTYRVADQCGNAITLTQRIIINDKTAPVITGGPQPVTLECDGAIPPVDISSIHATDNCGTVRVVWLGDMSDGSTCPKVIDRRYNVIDPCGNATTFHQTITVHDTTPPTLSNCASNRSLECPDGVSFTPPTATDNCDPSPEVKVVDSKWTYGPEGWTYRITKTYRAFDDCHNASTACTQEVKVHCQADHLCSLTQGAYGSYGGYFNGMTTLELVQSLLLNNPMTVGKPGRSVYMDIYDADCIIQRLPGNTTPSTLPAFGDKDLNQTTCQVGGPIPIPLNSGKFESVLLGQTITLIFNSRISAAMPLFPLTHTFCTQGALPGKDGLYGTADDKINPNDAIKTFTIPYEVLSALDKLGLPRIVYGLIELCNRGLAGQPTGGATLSQINDAADAINQGFEQCRFIVDCSTMSTTAGTKIDDPTSMSGMTYSMSAPTKFELKQNAPNPFNPITTIRLALPEAAPWTITVYDIQGKLVKRFNGHTSGPAFVDVQWNGTDEHGSPVASGVYLYRVHADNYVDVKKMVLLK